MVPGASTRSLPSICIEGTGTGTSTNCSAFCGTGRTVTRKAGWPRDLGHCDNLPGHTESTSLIMATSWSTICGSGTPRAGTTGATSASCPAVCLKTRSCGSESQRPNIARPIVRQIEELRLGSGGPPERRRVVLLAPPLPGPGRLQARCAVVRVRGQGRSDRLLLVSPPRAQSSLLATLSSSQSWAAN